MIVKCQSKQAFWNQLPTTIKVTVCRRSLYTLWSHTTGLDWTVGKLKVTITIFETIIIVYLDSTRKKVTQFYDDSLPFVRLFNEMSWTSNGIAAHFIGVVVVVSANDTSTLPLLLSLFEHLSIRRALHLVGIYSTNNKPSSRSTYYT